MSREKEENLYQIIRKDAKNCFVEVLNDSFAIGRAHLFFATYDLSKPKNQRYTNTVDIYLPMSEVVELCRKLEAGIFGAKVKEYKANKNRLRHSGSGLINFSKSRIKLFPFSS